MENSKDIQPLPELWINDDGFSWRGSHHQHVDITSIRFTATVTQNSINGIPTGKTYQALLSVKLHSGTTISLTGPGRAIRSGLKKETFEGLLQANAILSHVSLVQRLKPMENELATKGFFSFSGHQFNKSREVFRGGQLVAKLDNPDVSFFKESFSVVISRKKKGLGAKLIGTMFNDDIRVSLEWDQDCFLYMLKLATGYSWQDSPPPEKPINRKALYYQTVVRFGASLAIADGTADARELAQLRRFFEIDTETLPDAARLFNEELRIRSSVEDILSEFAQIFADAVQLRETFLVGMCTVALADGHLDDSELRKLRLAASVLRLGEGSLVRAFLAAGFDFETFMRDNRSGAGSTSKSGRISLELKILGLKPGATRDQVRMAYLELAKRYHPDILRGQGLPENEIAKAEAILKRINAAYEHLTRSNASTA